MTLLCKLLGHKFDLWIDGNSINPTKSPYYINKKLLPKWWQQSNTKLFIVCERCNLPFFLNMIDSTRPIITANGIKTFQDILRKKQK